MSGSPAPDALKAEAGHAGVIAPVRFLNRVSERLPSTLTDAQRARMPFVFLVNLGCCFFGLWMHYSVSQSHKLPPLDGVRIESIRGKWRPVEIASCDGPEGAYVEFGKDVIIRAGQGSALVSELVLGKNAEFVRLKNGNIVFQYDIAQTSTRPARAQTDVTIHDQKLKVVGVVTDLNTGSIGGAGDGYERCSARSSPNNYGGIQLINIRQKIQNKGPRFLIVVFDSCNSLIGGYPDNPLFATAPRLANNSTSAQALNRLFAARGLISLAGAEPGTEGWVGDQGGLFTLQLLNVFTNSVGKGVGDWSQIVKSATARIDDGKGHAQLPVSEMIMK